MPGVEQVEIFLGHSQLFRRSVDELRVEKAKSFCQGMHRASVFQVPYHVYDQVVQASLGLLNGI